MKLPETIQLAKAANDLNIYWFEEPLHHENFDGYQTLKNQTGISLAMGEREFNTQPLIELIKRKAIDIWQPDISENWRCRSLERKRGDCGRISHSGIAPIITKIMMCRCCVPFPMELARNLLTGSMIISTIQCW